MKKIFSAVVILVFLLGVSAAYACGEKKSSAEAKAAKAEASSVRSSSSSGDAAAAAAAGKADEVSAVTTQAIQKSSNSCLSKKRMSGVKKAAATGGCHSADPAAARKASVKSTKADAEYCAPSPDCPNPCVKESGAKKAKMENSSKSKGDGMASTSKIAAPEAETMK
jgi:hypothetical protein